MSKIFTAKTVEEAVEAGLKELGVTKEDVEVLVLEQGSKGFLGLGVKPARVQLVIKETETAAPEQRMDAPKKKKAPQTAKPKKQAEQTETPAAPAVPVEPSEQAAKTMEFLKGLFEELKLNCTVKLLEETSEKVVMNIETEDSSSVIGYRGEVLDSFQTFAGAVYNSDKEKYLRVVVDCENYRAKREKTLTSLAKKLAQKAVATGRKITLEPMNPYERRIIHSALMNFEGVKTVSEGKEPNRFVAIIPEGYDPSKERRGGNFRHGGKGKGGTHNSTKPAQKKSTGFAGGVFLGNSLKDKE